MDILKCLAEPLLGIVSNLITVNTYMSNHVDTYIPNPIPEPAVAMYRSYLLRNFGKAMLGWRWLRAVNRSKACGILMHFAAKNLTRTLMDLWEYTCIQRDLKIRYVLRCLSLFSQVGMKKCNFGLGYYSNFGRHLGLDAVSRQLLWSSKVWAPDASQRWAGRGGLRFRGSSGDLGRCRDWAI